VPVPQEASLPIAALQSTARRGRGPVPWAAAAEADLAAGTIVVIHPEGFVTRLALTTDAVVMPVAQWGAQRVHHQHADKLNLRLRSPADYLAGAPVDRSVQRALPTGQPLTGEPLKETTDLIMSRVRDELAELRGQPAALAFHPRRELRGDVSGSAA
jgi:hypothetical protein